MIKMGSATGREDQVLGKLSDLYEERRVLYETYAEVTIHQASAELNLTRLVGEITDCYHRLFIKE